MFQARKILLKIGFILSIFIPLAVQSKTEEKTEDPNYSQTVIEAGKNWQLIEANGVIDDTDQSFKERYFIVSGVAGINEISIPDTLKNELVADATSSDILLNSSFEENEPAGNREKTYVVNQRIADEIAASLAQGTPTDFLMSIAESPDLGDEPSNLMGKPYQGLGSCDDRDITKGKHIAHNASVEKTWDLGDGFSGTLNLTAGAEANADGEVSITLKRAKVLFLCIPYGVKFNYAHVWGNGKVEQNATLSGELKYSNQKPWTWNIAKPFLFSVNFMAGPIPVHIGFNLPLTAGIDKGGLNASLTGVVNYSGQGSIYGEFNYKCTIEGCSGSSSFNTEKITPGNITTSISGRFQPSIYFQMALRGYLYNESIAYAQIGIRPYIKGDLWGYYGNTCGDADGNGSPEIVDALTFDLDWQVYITAQVDTFLTEEWNRNLWKSPTWHVKYWDLLNASDAVAPLLIGPANAAMGIMQAYGVKMRPCWPYEDKVNYTVDWGDGSNQLLNAAPDSGSASHAWSQAGTPLVTLTALNDAHGRVFNRSTSRSVNVGVATHKGMTWVVLGEQGSFSHVGSDKNTDELNGDTDPATALPILCIRPKEDMSIPDDIVFDENNGWASGYIGLTSVVKGASLISREFADSICAARFTSAYRMASLQDGGASSWWAKGIHFEPGVRFWVANDNQAANPWD